MYLEQCSTKSECPVNDTHVFGAVLYKFLTFVEPLSVYLNFHETF